MATTNERPRVSEDEHVREVGIQYYPLDRYGLITSLLTIGFAVLVILVSVVVIAVAITKSTGNEEPSPIVFPPGVPTPAPATTLPPITTVPPPTYPNGSIIPTTPPPTYPNGSVIPTTPPPAPCNSTDNVTCTAGPGQEFPDLQSALDGCGCPFTSYIYIECVGAVPANNVTFPLYHLEIHIYAPTSDSSVTTAELSDASGWLLDYAGYPPEALFFTGLFFEGSNTTVGLFEETVMNNNVTFTDCYFANYSSPILYSQESCLEQTSFSMINCTIVQFNGTITRLLGMGSIYIEDNYCEQCIPGEYGAWYMQPNEITTGEIVIDGNAYYRLWDRQPERCRYALDPFDDSRCNGAPFATQGQVQCYDMIGTAAKGNCQLETITTEFDNTSLTYQDFNPVCRTFVPCACNPVQFFDESTRSVVTYYVGDILYNNNNDGVTFYTLPCVAGGSVMNNTNLTFVMNLGDLGVPTVNQTLGWSSGVISTGAYISPDACPCNATTRQARNPQQFACEYMEQLEQVCVQGPPIKWPPPPGACQLIPNISPSQAYSITQGSALPSCCISNITSTSQLLADGLAGIGLCQPQLTGEPNGQCCYDNRHCFNMPTRICQESHSFCCADGLVPAIDVLGGQYFTNCFTYNTSHSSAYYGCDYYSDCAAVSPLELTSCNYHTCDYYVDSGVLYSNPVCSGATLDNNTVACTGAAGDQNVATCSIVDPSTGNPVICAARVPAPLLQGNFTLPCTVNYTTALGANHTLTCLIKYTSVNYNFTQTASVQTLYPAQAIVSDGAGSDRTFYYDVAFPDGYPVPSPSGPFTCAQLPNYACIFTTFQDLSGGLAYCNAGPTATPNLYTCQTTAPAGAPGSVVTLPCEVGYTPFEGRPQGATFTCEVTYDYDTYGNPHVASVVSTFGVEAAFDQVQVVNSTYSFLNNQSQFQCEGAFNAFTNYTCVRDYTNPLVSLAPGKAVTCYPVDVTANYTGELYPPLPYVSLFTCHGTVQRAIPVDYEYACNSTPGVSTPFPSVIQFATPGHSPTETSSNVTDAYTFFETSFRLLSASNQALCTSNTYFNCSASNYTCDCSDTLVASLQPPPPVGVPVYWLVGAESELSLLQIIDNRAIDTYYGWMNQDVSLPLIQLNSLYGVVYTDEFSNVREIARNDNEFVNGTAHWFVENTIFSRYQFACDNLCPQPYTQASDFECIVDATATPQNSPGAYGVTIFPGVKEVILAIFNSYHGDPTVCNGTKSILIRNTIGYYTVSQDASDRYNDQIYLGDEHSNMYMASLPGQMASFLGNIVFCGDAVNVTFRGIRFLALNGNNAPTFGPSGGCTGTNTPGPIVLWNNYFDGTGSTGGGVYSSTLPLLADFRYNTVVNFITNTFSFSGNFVNVSYNAFIGCTGQTIGISAAYGWQFISNTMANCRGGSGNAGAVITNFVAQQDDTCDMSDDQHTCLMTRNVWNTDESDTDYADTCMQMSQGSCNLSTIYDWSMSKCQFGAIFMNTGVDTSLGEIFFLHCPLVRPSENYLPDISPELIGSDLVIETASFRLNQADFSFPLDITCNFPCSAAQTLLFQFGLLPCIVNRNYLTETMLQYCYTCYSYGYNLYHNLSDAGKFCNNTQEVDTYSTIHISNLNGSRLRHDNITLYHNIILDGRDNTSFCRLPNYRPVIEGVGNVIACNATAWYELEFWLSQSIVQLNMWSTAGYLPQYIDLTGITFDGRMLIPETSSTAFYAVIGIDFTVPAGPPLVVQEIPIVHAHFVMQNCSFINFTSYNPVLVSPTENRQISNVLSTNFPNTNGLYLSFINSNNSFTLVNISDCYFENIDDNAITVSYAIHTVINNCTFINVTGRANTNLDGIDIAGNLLPDATGSGPTCNFTNIYYNQTKPTIYHFDGNKGFPGHVAAVFIHGYPCNSTICIENVTIAGTMDVGLRFASDNCSSIVSCLSNSNPPFFADDLADLRAIAMNRGNNINGTWSDIVDCEPEQDLCGQCLICDGVCPVLPPTVCYIDLDNPKFIPANPWYGVYVFPFPQVQECIDKCQAASRTCVFIGTQDLFGLFTVIPFKSYHIDLDLQIPQFSGNASTANFTNCPNTTSSSENCTLCLNATSSANCTGCFNTTSNCTQGVPKWFTGPVTLQGSDGMEIYGCNHKVNNTWEFGVNFVGLTLRDSHVCTATWNQPSSHSSINLAFLGNLWNGNGSSQSVLSGTYDSPFNFNFNIVEGYLGTLGVDFTARTCQDVATVDSNTFYNLPGASLEIHGVQSYYVRDNDFVNCGGEASLPGYITWMNPCGAGNAAAAGVRYCAFSGNSATSTFTTFAACGNWTSYYFDPLPIPDLLYDPALFESNSTLCIQDIGSNTASGLELGMRLNGIPKDASPSSDCRRLMRFFAVIMLNLGVTGIYHDISNATCTEDAAVGLYPVLFGCFYCDGGCFTDAYSSLAIFAYSLFAILIMSICLCYACCSCCTRDIEYVLDPYLMVMLPNIYYIPRFAEDPHTGAKQVSYDATPPAPGGANLGTGMAPARFIDPLATSPVFPDATQRAAIGHPPSLFNTRATGAALADTTFFEGFYNVPAHYATMSKPSLRYRHKDPAEK